MKKLRQCEHAHLWLTVLQAGSASDMQTELSLRPSILEFFHLRYL